MPKRQSHVEAAARTLVARRERRMHPEGTQDAAGRWWPSLKYEHQPCCDERPPSAERPYALLEHCRSMRHVAQLHDVSYISLYRAVRALDAAAAQEATAS